MRRPGDSLAQEAHENMNLMDLSAFENMPKGDSFKVMVVVVVKNVGGQSKDDFA